MYAVGCCSGPATFDGGRQLNGPFPPNVHELRPPSIVIVSVMQPMRGVLRGRMDKGPKPSM
jgi:hypothetical protein